MQILVAGALLTRGRHTIANALRLMGLGDCTRFQCYHRVLSRDKWNPRHAAKILQALLCTGLSAEPVQILSWFVQRSHSKLWRCWHVEKTFLEVRAHLGVESQRQWTDLAITRTTPALMGLFSLVTLVAHRLDGLGKLTIADTAWYHKQTVTFSDAIAAIRREIWHHRIFGTSPSKADITKFGAPAGCVIDALCETLGYSP